MCICSLRALALILVAFVATFVAACQPKATLMTPEESLRIETMTAKMTTRCVGRYLIDMPQSFSLNSESTTTVDGVNVSVRPMEKRIFELRLESREAAMRRPWVPGAYAEPKLMRIESTPSIVIGKVFNRTRESHLPGGLDIARTLDLYAWRDGYEIKLTIDSIDASDPRYSADNYWKNRGSDTPNKLALLLQVYERISGRKDTDIPTAPGLCIPNGFVAGADREGQETDAVYHLVDAPDVWFGFGSSDAVREESTLLQRSPRAEKALEKAGTKILRKGERNIHG